MSPSRTLPFLLAATLLAGCGVDVDFWDEREFDVDVPASQEPKITQSIDVDLKDNAQFKDVLAKLQSVDIVEIWLEVPEVQEGNAATKVSGSIHVSELADGAEKVLVASYTDLPIAQGGKIQLEWDAAGYEKLKELAFEDPHQFKLHVSGALDQAPANFKLKSRIHVVAGVGL